MTRALELLGQALGQILGYPGVALRVSGLPILIGAALLLVGRETMAAGRGDGLSFVFSVLIAAYLIVAFLWIGVAWHRFVVLGERPGLWPAWHGRATLDYLARAAILGAIYIGSGMILGVLWAGAAGMFAGDGGGGPAWLLSHPAFGAVVGALLDIFLIWITLRLGVMLPAAAVGAPIGPRDAWRTTRGQGAALLVLAVILRAALPVLHWPAAILAGFAPFAAMAWLALLRWLTLMLGLALLSTLYRLRFGAAAPDPVADRSPA